MNFGEVRELVLAETGRLDAETKRVGSTTLVDFYINQASRYLDLRPELDRDIVNYRGNIREAEVSPDLPLCRSIESVWRLSSADLWIQLEKVELTDLLTRYPKVENTDRSTPVVWTPHTLAKFGDTTDYTVGLKLFEAGIDLYGLTLMPPPSAEMTIGIFGLFFSEKLEQEADQNFWTANHPKLLSLAVGWCMESANRNREGMLDFEAAMSIYLTGIRFDKVEQDIAGGVKKEYDSGY